MSFRTLSALALALVLLCSQAAVAGKAKSQPGDGFDPAKQETIIASVRAINYIEASSRNGYLGKGVELIVEEHGQELSVPLGPRYFLDLQPVKLAVGDQVQITGMRSPAAGSRPVFLASQIKKDKLVTVFRDSKGIPRWRKLKVVDAPRSTLPPPMP